MAGTKQSIHTNCGCPQCETKTSNFHLPCSYTNTDILRTPEKMTTIYNHGQVLLRSRQKGVMEAMCKEYSVNLVSVKLGNFVYIYVMLFSLIVMVSYLCNYSPEWVLDRETH